MQAMFTKYTTTEHIRWLVAQAVQTEHARDGAKQLFKRGELLPRWFDEPSEAVELLWVQYEGQLYLTLARWANARGCLGLHVNSAVQWAGEMMTLTGPFVAYKHLAGMQSDALEDWRRLLLDDSVLIDLQSVLHYELSLYVNHLGTGSIQQAMTACAYRID